MSGFRNNISLNRSISQGILKNIISKLLICCDLMRDDCIKNSLKINNLEEDIRDYLYVNYLNDDDIMEKVGLDEFRFYSEVPENYQNNKPKGRTDLHVFSIDMFKHRKQYFTIECKRINGKKTLNRYYIENGIKRFLGEQPLYSSFFGMNCLFSFVVEDIDIEKNTDEINGLISCDYEEINVKSPISHIEISSSYDYTYKSEYVANHDIDILLYHVFYNFTSIIK
ncbi:hypothetical protein [Sedimentibacter sp.]|uniref:hypothetical protein n=1 Tax=Sedimentibacter sp. TaxID=1960295 RepID=UPI0028977AC9|nr:hypothetical protein [Sedimentibacter sp.]